MRRGARVCIPRVVSEVWVWERSGEGAGRSGASEGSGGSRSRGSVASSRARANLSLEVRDALGEAVVDGVALALASMRLAPRADRIVRVAGAVGRRSSAARAGGRAGTGAGVAGSRAGRGRTVAGAAGPLALAGCGRSGVSASLERACSAQHALLRLLQAVERRGLVALDVLGDELALQLLEVAQVLRVHERGDERAAGDVCGQSADDGHDLELLVELLDVERRVAMLVDIAHALLDAGSEVDELLALL